jgi:hypothetical protein
MASNASPTGIDELRDTAVKSDKLTKRAKFAASRPERALPVAPFSVTDFVAAWQQASLAAFGKPTECLERDTSIRGANSKVDPRLSDIQSKAQYGRLLPAATDVRSRFGCDVESLMEPVPF